MKSSPDTALSLSRTPRIEQSDGTLFSATFSRSSSSARDRSQSSRLAGVGALIRELQAFERKITPHRRLRFEGSGEHDDLVVATALAVWWAAMQKVLGRESA